MIPPVNFCGGPPINYHFHSNDDASPINSTNDRSPTFTPSIDDMASGSSSGPFRSSDTFYHSDGASSSQPSTRYTDSSSSPVSSGTEASESQSLTPGNSNTVDPGPFPILPSSQPTLLPTPPPTPPPTAPLNPLPTPSPTPKQPSSSDIRPVHVVNLESWPPNPDSSSLSPQRRLSDNSGQDRVVRFEEPIASEATYPTSPQHGSSSASHPVNVVSMEYWQPSPPSSSPRPQRRSANDSHPDHVVSLDNADAPAVANRPARVAEPPEHLVRAYQTNSILDLVGHVLNGPKDLRGEEEEEAHDDDNDDCASGLFESHAIALSHPSPVQQRPLPPLRTPSAFLSPYSSFPPRAAPAPTPTPQPTTTPSPTPPNAFLHPFISHRLCPRPRPVRIARTAAFNAARRAALATLNRYIPRTLRIPPGWNVLCCVRHGDCLRPRPKRHAAQVSSPPPFATDTDGFDFAEPVVPAARLEEVMVTTLEVDRADGCANITSSIAPSSRRPRPSPSPSPSPTTTQSWTETRLYPWFKTEAEILADKMHREAWDRTILARRRDEVLYEGYGRRKRVGEGRSNLKGVDTGLSGGGECERECERDAESIDKRQAVDEGYGELERGAECEPECLPECLREADGEGSGTGDGSGQGNSEDEGRHDECAYDCRVDGVGGFRVKRRSRNEVDVEASGDGDGYGDSNSRIISVREYVRLFDSLVAGTAHRGGLGRYSVLERM